MASSQIGFRGLIPIAVLFILGLASCQGSVQGRTVAGIVKHEDQPVPGAVVRLQTTEIHTLTGPDGRFSLQVPGQEDPVNITAWSAGYYIAGLKAVTPGSDQLEIILEKHPDSDHPDYDWLPAGSGAGEGEDQGCGQCHSSAGTDLSQSLPYDQWIQDAHSQSALNPRFLSTYLGTDLDGNQSPLTRFNYAKAYGTYPLRPDLSQPYYGPGYKLDFPGSAGNCAACHAPAAAINDPYGVDPSLVSGVGAEGVTCDFCHKVWDVELDSSSGLPKDNAPGVLSFSFRRPPPGRQFFAGPFDDVAPGEDTYSPLQRESQYLRRLPLRHLLGYGGLQLFWRMAGKSLQRSRIGTELSKLPHANRRGGLFCPPGAGGADPPGRNHLQPSHAGSGGPGPASECCQPLGGGIGGGGAVDRTGLDLE